MKRPRLQRVLALSGYKLDITFIDGQRAIVFLADDIRRLPGLSPLQDMAVFSTAKIADNGWTVEWEEYDIQIGADTLWLETLKSGKPKDAGCPTRQKYRDKPSAILIKGAQL
ncbi:MAG: DUF2442 domain-containing protein [Desulfatirhabdiaceae bacterium]